MMKARVYKKGNYKIIIWYRNNRPIKIVITDWEDMRGETYELGLVPCPTKSTGVWLLPENELEKLHRDIISGAELLYETSIPN